MSAPATPPLIILGIDAGDPTLIERWAREGYLPTVASIMERGSWGKTCGIDLLNEHGSMISLLSGVSCREHGFYYSRQLRPNTYDLHTTTGRDAHTLPFWSHLRHGGKKVAIVDAPDIFPVEGVDGIQLADWASHNPRFEASAAPETLLTDVRRIFGPRMVIEEKPGGTAADNREIHKRLLERAEKKGTLCRELCSRDHFDLVTVVFSESHPALHQFWDLREEAGEPPPEWPEAPHAIRDVYQAIDRQLGLLLEVLPSPANVFIVTSVGVSEQYPTMELTNVFCRKLGYQACPEPGRVSLSPMGWLRRLVPESWRIAVSRNFSRETRERLLAEQFRSSTNWKKTTLFAIPSLYTGMLRVNLRGREPEGIVAPGEEYEALLDRAQADLEQLVDPQTGEAAVERVVRTAAVFGGGPPDRLPDLMVVWKPGNHFVRRVVHPSTELLQEKPEFYRSTHHCDHGFVAAAGPALQQRGALPDIEVLDLAPTFLKLLDEPVPETLTGQEIRSLLADRAK
jgi:predicted AlkP superfamily phosphohydrolase/phosphomutase